MYGSNEEAFPQFRVYLCGPFQLERRVGETFVPVSLSEWQGRTGSRTVLKALLGCPGRQARRDVLLALLWPDEDPQHVGAIVQKAVASLRHLFGSCFLEHGARSNLYQLAPQEQVWVDVDAAQQLLATAEQRGRTSLDALPLLEEAAGYLNRGIFLEEEDGPWAVGRQATVEQVRYRCRLWLAEAYEQQGMPGQAETVLSRLLEEDPTDEDVLSRLLSLFHRQGMTHQALRLYEHVCNLFSIEGIELTAATKSLMAHIQENRQHAWEAVDASFPLIPQILLPGEGSNEPKEKEAESLDRSRRTLLQQFLRVTETITISPAVAASLSGLERLSYDPPQLLSKHEVTPEKLQDFATLTDICRRLSEGNELHTAEKLLWSYLPRVEALVTETAREPQMAASIVSQGYLLAASLVGHHNDLRARQYYSEQALLYGEIAQNDTFQVAALRQLAATFQYLRLPHKVMQTYQRALPHLDKVPPLLCSCIYAALSGVYAQFQQKNNADHYIGLAYESFGEHQGDEPDFLRAINASQNLLIHWHGKNHLRLGQPHLAEKVLLQLDVLDPKMKLPKRIRVEAVNNRARMFIAVGNMEQACIYLDTALKIALEIGSTLRLQEIVDTFQSLKSTWPHERKIQQLGNLFIQSLVNHVH